MNRPNKSMCKPGKIKYVMSVILLVAFVPIYLGVRVYAYTPKNIALRVLINSTFTQANPGSGKADEIVNKAKIPFNATWNLVLNGSYVYVGTLPVDLCTLTLNNHCTAADCGGGNSSCTNSTTNNIHHKNITKNLNVIKQSFSVSPYNLLTTFIGTYACAKSGLTHIYPAGMADVSGKYSICTFVSPPATPYYNIRILQHELSHNYGCGHCSYDTGACIMKGSYDNDLTDRVDIWCSTCKNQFNRDLH